MGMFHQHGKGGSGFDRNQLRGMRALKRLKDVTDRRTREQLERGLDLGLEAAPSVQDRTISLFSRGAQPAFAGINTFIKAPYCENIRDVGKYDVAVVGAPFDMGTTYRAGCRFGPQAVRRISALYDSYNADMGVDLYEELNLCDAGDIFVIPSNIEKSFDQIDMAVSFIHEQGAFPVVIGGDHSIGYPDVRAIAPHIEGKVGIIHLDRHIDMQERDMDERMHTTPWFHASNIPNAPPANLVQMGIGGWYGSRPGMKVARERGSTVITISDVEELGVEQGRRGRARVRLEGRRSGLPVLRHRLHRRRLRARDRLARAGRPASARSAEGAANGRPRGDLRDGGGGDRTALRRLRHDRPARRSRDHGRARDAGGRGPPRQPPVAPGARAARARQARAGGPRARMTGWLNGKAALAVLSFDVDAESPILAAGRRYADHAMAMTHQAFGPLVGVPRLLALLAEYELPATFFVPGLTAERYPETVRRIAEAGHEIGHHSYSHRSPVDLSESEERADFERALAALGKLGVDPSGHRAALWEASWRTPALVAEYGMSYDSSLMDSDRPYRLGTDGGTVIELPRTGGSTTGSSTPFCRAPTSGA